MADERPKVNEGLGVPHRLELAAEAAGLGLGSINLTTGAVTWNNQMWLLIGRMPEAVVMDEQQWLEDVVHPDDREGLALASVRWHDKGQQDCAFVSEYRVVWPGGTVRRLATRLIKRDGFVHGVTFDVTDVHSAHVALGEAQQRALLAARGAGLGTWEHDLGDSITTWDEQMCVLHGLDPATAAGPRRDALAFLLPEDVELALTALQAAIDTGTTLAHEARVRWPDGNVRWLALRASILCNDRGEPVRVLGVAWDVTSKHEAEDALRAEQRALAASEAKSQLLTQISHELRTPLNAVLGFAQLLQAEHRLQGSDAVAIEQIRQGGEHLLALVNDLLDLAAVEAGRLQVSAAPVSVDEVMRECLALMVPLAAARGVELVVGSLSGLVSADRLRLRQVLINLLGNGIKYNARGGRLEVASAVHGRVVRLSFKDQGPGFQSEQLARMFEPFNRLGAERLGVEGTGIGLALVKSLVELMGGEVRVLSQPAHGACFEVELPQATAADEATSTASAPVSVADAALTVRGRVLYVEDDPVNTLLLQQTMRLRPGIELRCAGTGLEGLAAAVAFRPDLAILDMNLPDMTGIELRKRLASDPRTAALCCVALSADCMADDIARALAAGFKDYWPKPINLVKLLNSLDRLMAG